MPGRTLVFRNVRFGALPRGHQLLVLFSRLKGFLCAGLIWLPPDEPHELAIRWTADA
jgi:hypothetical protein